MIDDGVGKEYRFEYGLEMLVWAQVLAYRTDAVKGDVPKGWPTSGTPRSSPATAPWSAPATAAGPSSNSPPWRRAFHSTRSIQSTSTKPFASYDKIKKDVIKWWDTGAMPIQLLTDAKSP